MQDEVVDLVVVLDDPLILQQIQHCLAPIVQVPGATRIAVDAYFDRNRLSDRI